MSVYVEDRYTGCVFEYLSDGVCKYTRGGVRSPQGLYGRVCHCTGEGNTSGLVCEYVGGGGVSVLSQQV